MESDAFFMSLARVGEESGCSPEDVAEAKFILEQNSIQVKLSSMHIEGVALHVDRNSQERLEQVTVS